MALEVLGSTRDKADKCWRGFICLSGEESGICVVQYSVSDLLFVERTREGYCPYDVGFGYSHICSCPVRQELYERYGE